jgi:hypothetical protein
MDKCSKRHISWLYKYLFDNKYDVDILKNDINNIIVKTIIAGLPHLNHY